MARPLDILRARSLWFKKCISFSEDRFCLSKQCRPHAVNLANSADRMLCLSKQCRPHDAAFHLGLNCLSSLERVNKINDDHCIASDKTFSFVNAMHLSITTCFML